MSTVFEDVHEYSTTNYYLVPNEEPLLWREILKYTHIERAAGICSAGEVGFFGLLPLVRRDLTLIDHSYSSLAIAVFKYIMLREYGPEETIRMLTSGSNEELEANFEKLTEHLPPQLKKALRDTRYGARYTVGSYLNRSSSLIASMWKTIPPELVKKAARKLDRVSFVHGDLSDLVDRGPFDLLYISNALEHSGRDGRPSLDVLENVVRPGGLVVGTRNTHTVERWELLDTRIGRGSSWTYHLYKTPEKKAA